MNTQNGLIAQPVLSRPFLPRRGVHDHLQPKSPLLTSQLQRIADVRESHVRAP